MSKAFSLVELSIVLVILGLLVGGVLAGKSLIRASELRSVTTEYQRYLTATRAFRDKYFALPGDMANATNFWGTAGTCPGTSASPSTTSATCNGNGDGVLTAAGASSNEMYRFWQHLANAALIEGQFTGVSDSTTASNLYSLIGTNVPASKLSAAGWSTGLIPDQIILSTSWFEGAYGNIFVFGRNNSNTWTSYQALKPEEAWNIDTKLDDGKPGLGVIVTTENRTSCHDAGTSNSVALAPTANYALNNDDIYCHLVFRPKF